MKESLTSELHIFFETPHFLSIIIYIFLSLTTSSVRRPFVDGLLGTFLVIVNKIIKSNDMNHSQSMQNDVFL